MLSLSTLCTNALYVLSLSALSTLHLHTTGTLRAPYTIFLCTLLLTLCALYAHSIDTLQHHCVHCHYYVHYYTIILPILYTHSHAVCVLRRVSRLYYLRSLWTQYIHYMRPPKTLQTIRSLRISYTLCTYAENIMVIPHLSLYALCSLY
jgi:hypothetical protein